LGRFLSRTGQVINLNKWRMYDELIDGIPADITVEDFFIGHHWTTVRAGGHTGIAMTMDQPGPPSLCPDDLRGVSLCEAAALSKSWNFLDATIGMAAINAWYNTAEKMLALGVLPKEPEPGDLETRKKREAFGASAGEVAGKKVTVIGHFPNLERDLAPMCRLTILERCPQEGDFPDSACEFLLPEQDFVFITGITFTNKTLPRLLQIIDGGAKVTMVGPTVPLAPVLFQHGIDNLSGFCITDPVILDACIRRASIFGIFKGGRMVSFNRPK
jgi:uncharacterized protein (DUF4213/DUF364 family)